MDGGVARERICPFSIGHISLGGIFPLRHISSGGKHVSSSGCWVADGSVSYSSVLEAICSYCSRMSICNQCGNIFDFKGNLKKHMTTSLHPQKFTACI